MSLEGSGRLLSHPILTRYAISCLVLATGKGPDYYMQHIWWAGHRLGETDTGRGIQQP